MENQNEMRDSKMGCGMEKEPELRHITQAGIVDQDGVVQEYCSRHILQVEGGGSGSGEGGPRGEARQAASQTTVADKRMAKLHPCPMIIGCPYFKIYIKNIAVIISRVLSFMGQFEETGGVKNVIPPLK